VECETRPNVGARLMPALLDQIGSLSDDQLREGVEALASQDSDDMRFYREAMLREQDRRQESRGFCPTGPGGGIDNSCGKKSTGFEAVSKALQEYTSRFDGSSLARPRMVLGMGDVNVSAVKFSEYLESRGQEWEAAPLPESTLRGIPQSCYENATKLVLSNPGYDYAEGLAYPDGMGGMGVLHAWAVDRKTNKVIDNTWDNPEKCRYFGVRYDRKKYMRHVALTRFYGVVGGDDKAAAKVLKKGGL
jgi:hypothetical protein